MKAKIQAGAEIDLLTEKELRGALADASAAWRADNQTGIRWKRTSAVGVADGAGNIVIGYDLDRGQLGPAAGFVWLVRRIAVTAYVPPSAGGTNSLSVYLNEVTSSNVIAPGPIDAYQDLYHEFLTGGQKLVVAGTVANNARCWVTLALREAPESLAWRL